MTLQDFFRANPKAALAFSGGTDSAYLLWAASQWDQDVKAYYVHSPFQPAFELADAKRLAEELGISVSAVNKHIVKGLRTLREKLKGKQSARCSDGFAIRR